MLFSIPLAVSVCEFNESMHGNSKRLSAVMAVYQRCLLALTGQAIRLECDIKNGLANFTDEVTFMILAKFMHFSLMYVYSAGLQI